MKDVIGNLIKGAFNKLGDDADIILIEIAENDSLMNVLRFRALEVLSLFPSDNTVAFLEDTAEKAFTPMEDVALKQ
ncbi:MAG: hypothetical protein CM1200mP28_14410 [Deltaproteobacteria bacterium]|nr:MAG: hypothetical protein CM1200mP28_14410 [Deltaproteobacteria bacterium]